MEEHGKYTYPKWSHDDIIVSILVPPRSNRGQYMKYKGVYKGIHMHYTERNYKKNCAQWINSLNDGS